MPEQRSKLNRRTILRTAALMAGASAVNPIGLLWAQTNKLRRTADQILGPFYPVEGKFEHVDDLTHLPGKDGRAKGQLLEVSGRVLTTDGEPVRGARLEIWQANAAGRYAHPDDRNPAPLDPNFLGYTTLVSSDDGTYRFRTIKPGAYPTGPDEIRPPHIHFEVFGRRDTLVTQMYFEGDALNEKDRWLQSLRRPERLMVKVRPASGSPEMMVAEFDLVIRG